MWFLKESVMDWLFPISVGVSAVGICSYIYGLLKDNGDGQGEILAGTATYTADSTSIEIKVPRFSVGNVVGRHGQKIREIQVLSNTRMFLKDPRLTDMKICVIRGLAENVAIAEKYVYESVLAYPDVSTVEIFVPVRICCILTTRYGDDFRWIRRVTHCKIILDNWCFHNNYSTRRIFLRGSYESIERARNFFAQKVEEDEQPPVTPSGSLPVPSRNRGVNADSDDDDFLLDLDEVFSTGNNGLLEVYVASIENPESFWVQIMGPSILTLDQLIDDMTCFYEKPANRRKYALKEAEVGQLVAAPFQYDNRWYRAEIKKVCHNVANDKITSLEVFYIDHGDTGSYKKREVFELAEQFLGLRHQAIRCILANVKPRGDTWCEDSIQLFSKLTASGLWKTLSAKVVDYRCPPSSFNKQTLPLPCIQLLEGTHLVYMDIAAELVKRGHAEWLNDNHARY